MSRYVRTTLQAISLAEIASALTALGIDHVWSQKRRLMLAGSVECAGEPVDIRLEAHVHDAVEDFGFVVNAQTGEVQLVCGELDRSTLEETLVTAIQREIATGRVQMSARAQGLAAQVDNRGGRRRIVVRQTED